MPSHPSLSLNDPVASKVYRIRDWNKHFENNRSRVMETMRWLPVPNKHDGEGYRTIMAEEDGLAIYGAWHLILQVASKCTPRGSLVRLDGTPMNARSIALKAGWLREKDIQRALDFCASPEVGWIDVETSTNTPEIEETSCQRHANVMPTLPTQPASDATGNGMEENVLQDTTEPGTRGRGECVVGESEEVTDEELVHPPLPKRDTKEPVRRTVKLALLAHGAYGTPPTYPSEIVKGNILHLIRRGRLEKHIEDLIEWARTTKHQRAPQSPQALTDPEKWEQWNRMRDRELAGSTTPTSEPTTVWEITKAIEVIDDQIKTLSQDTSREENKDEPWQPARAVLRAESKTKIKELKSQKQKFQAKLIGLSNTAAPIEPNEQSPFTAGSPPDQKQQTNNLITDLNKKLAVAKEKTE